MELIHKYIIKTAQSYPGKKAIISDKKDISYGDFLKYTVILSDTLILEGMHRGDRVLILLSDPIDLIIACSAVIRSGGIAVPIQTTLPPSEIFNIINRTSPFLIITNRSNYKLLPSLSIITGQLPFFYDDVFLSEISSSPPSQHLSEFKDENWNKILRLTNLKKYDYAFMNYDSISKKLSVFTQQSILHSALKINSLTSLLTDSIEFITTPITNIIGFNRVIHLLTSGGTCVICSNSSDILEYPSMIVKHNCNTWYATYETITAAINQISALMKDVSSRIKLIGISGDIPIAFQDKQKILDVFVNAKIYLNYGPPEAPTSTILDLRNNKTQLNTYGAVAPSVEISGNTDGKILIHGPHLMVGYWNDNKLDKTQLDEKGWFITNDFGVFDKNEKLQQVYKKDEVIKINNALKPVIEIEENMKKLFPDYEMCIVGISDPLDINNEVLVLCFSEIEGTTINRSELLNEFQKQVNDKNILVMVKKIKNFPKVGNKILRHELKKLLLDYNIFAEIENMKNEEC